MRDELMPPIRTQELSFAIFIFGILKERKLAIVESFWAQAVQQS
jgi:hypothetical protein